MIRLQVQVRPNQRGGLTGGCFGNAWVLVGHGSKADSYHKGQIEGGVVMGLGQALMEELVMESG